MALFDNFDKVRAVVIIVTATSPHIAKAPSQFSLVLWDGTLHHCSRLNLVWTRLLGTFVALRSKVVGNIFSHTNKVKRHLAVLELVFVPL